jgi:hypothetical protein
MKNALLILFLIISKVTFAQTFTIKAGLNLSNMVIKDNSKIYSEDFNMNPGFHAEITYDYQFSNKFMVETGLLLSTKGFKQNESQTGTSGVYNLSQTLDLYYLVIPYNGKLYFEKLGMKIYVLLGPYLGLGLSGKRKLEGNLYGSSSSNETKIKWGSESQNDLRRFDFGLTMGAGIQIKSLEIGISYDLGLSNMMPDDFNLYSTNIKSRVLAVSIGYLLNLKKNN